MKKMISICILSALSALLLSACGGGAQMAAAAGPELAATNLSAQNGDAPYTAGTPISDVTGDPVFGSYGRLIFPANTGYYSGDTLGDLRLTWYSHIDPDKTVEIANTMYLHAKAGDTIFYDIYTDEEKAADPAKKDTGLFFFKGTPGERFAICNAGGGFAYVGAMHDSFPHALELSKMGYNAFALIYRPGAQTACEDLARAITFIFEHADELEVDTACYSLWGGSAGGRMAATLGSYGPEAFGGGDLPRPGAVIMQYTGHSEYTEGDPPTYACVGTSDGIASWRTMERRLEALEAQGIPTEFHTYEGLGHGFGLGKGTVAEGWIKDAAAFWENQFVTPGTETYRGFSVDNVLHSGANGDIHYNVYIPESYDGSKPYALFFTLPGYEGLYFQGVASNIKAESFGFEAQKYNEEMIVVAPQLSDWGETSANQTIALVEYFLKHYNIDPARVYANGYSGGGETMSIVMGKRPELFTAYLHCSSQWDGDYSVLAESRTPVYLAIGKNDEYYGSEPTQRAYDTLYGLYQEQGLSKEEIDRLLVLDIKEKSYFTTKGVNNEHGGGGLFAADEKIMGWLFSQTKRTALSGTIPEELEYVPEGYQQPARLSGTLEKLEYQTYESFSYAEKSQKLTKTAWVYLPYGYDESKQYNILYLSHGGWSNETTTMGTPERPHEFKHIVDHAIEDGLIQPLIIVLPTYNNTSESDSGSYSLALRLVDNFHNELVNDLIPAVESKYSTFAGTTDLEGIAASRDHRAFGGFSMGSMNTWHTFEYCLDYFRYFAPSSGGPIGNRAYMEEIVRSSGHSPEDFFIFTASGTDDFAYSGFKRGVMDMGTDSEVFTFGDSEAEGNLSFREREGYAHDGRAANEYMYNALRFFWNAE